MKFIPLEQRIYGDRKIALVLLAVAGLAGCRTYDAPVHHTPGADYDANKKVVSLLAEALVGKPIDDARFRLGEPEKSYTSSDGRRVLVFKRIGQPRPPETDQRWISNMRNRFVPSAGKPTECFLTFRTAAHGQTITDYSWRGPILACSGVLQLGTEPQNS